MLLISCQATTHTALSPRPALWGSVHTWPGLVLCPSSRTVCRCGVFLPCVRRVLVSQVQQGRRGRVGGKVQVNSRGVASLALQLRSDRPQWWGLAGLVPLVSLGWQTVTSALARRRGEGQGGPDGQDGEAGGAWDEQHQQQQYMPEELAQLLQQHQAAVLHQQQ